jgi:hypothetical protein
MTINVEKKPVGFKMPKNRHDILMKLVEKRGTGRGEISKIMNAAFDEYIERLENPEPERETIRKSLRDHPALLDEHTDAQLRKIVREEFQILFRQLSENQSHF